MPTLRGDRASLLVLCVAGGLVACAARAQPPAPLPPAAPALAIIPPNASRITALVTARAVWPPGSLARATPAARPDRTLYSLTLKVLAAAPTDATLATMAQPGAEIEAFAAEPVPPDLVGRRITAVVELTGTTQGTRWMITRIQAAP